MQISDLVETANSVAFSLRCDSYDVIISNFIVSMLRRNYRSDLVLRLLPQHSDLSRFPTGNSRLTDYHDGRDRDRARRRNGDASQTDADESRHKRSSKSAFSSLGSDQFCERIIRASATWSAG